MRPGGPNSLCTCGHICVDHQFQDPGYCSQCEKCKGFTDSGKTWGRDRILLKKGDSVTFNVKFLLTRWDLFVAMLDSQFKGIIYTEKRFDVTDITVREGVPQVEIEHDETPQ